MGGTERASIIIYKVEFDGEMKRCLDIRAVVEQMRDLENQQTDMTSGLDFKELWVTLKAVLIHERDKPEPEGNTNG